MSINMAKTKYDLPQLPCLKNNNALKKQDENIDQNVFKNFDYNLDFQNSN